MINNVQESALAEFSDIPQDENGPVFNEPWEAEAFAMTLSAYENGLFTWNEWAECLAESIAMAQAQGDPDDGSTYYNHWLSALENIVISKGVVRRDELQAVNDMWDQASHSTPHGDPIVIKR